MLLKDEGATAAKIRNAFRNFVALAKPDDLLVIYVASHGLHNPLDAGKIYLSAYDTQMKQLFDSAIEFGELQQLITTNVRSRNVVLAFDVGRKLAPDWQIAGSNLVNGYLLKLFSKDQGRAVLVSGGVNEISQEREAGGHYEGMFSSRIIEALSGKADWNQDHIVTVAELFRYVSDQVRADTNGSQTPRYLFAQESLPIVGASN